MKRKINIFIFSVVSIFYVSVRAQTGCDLNLIRQTFTGAGCTELQTCFSSCSMYFYNPLSQTGDAAQAWAQNYGANLISVQSAAENACIVSDLNNNGFSGIIWIGFNDAAQEGNFVCYDQSQVVYTNWNGGEPNNAGGNEDCVQIYPNGKWNDLNCSSGGSKSVIEVNLCPIVTITPTATTICAGQSVTLNASTILGSSPYTYNWVSNSGGFSSSSSGPTVSPVSTTTYSVTSTDRYGCTATTSIEITVNTSLNATITGTDTVCLGAPSPSVTFTGLSGTAPYTFSYAVNGGVIQTVTTTSGSSVALSAPTNSVGVSTYTLYDVSDNNGCSQARTGTVDITVTSLPTATVSGTTAICENASAPQITFTGSGGNEPYQFSYTINGGGTQTVLTTSGNSINVPVSTSSPGSYIYTLTGVMSDNSTYCAQLQSGTATVTVSPLPTASIGGTATVCKNATAPEITFDGGAGTPPYTFTYTINGGANQTISTTGSNSNVNLPVLTIDTGTFVYTLVSVEDSGTPSCSQPQSGSVTIKVLPLPTASISGDAFVCVNSTEPNVTFTGADGTPPYSFLYTINGTVQPAISTTAGSSISVAAPTAVAGTFTYSLISVTDASAAVCSQVQPDTVAVVVDPLPTAIVSGSTVVCKDDALPGILFTGASGTSPYTFSYSINGGGTLSVSSTNGDTISIPVPTSVADTFIYSLISVQDASTAVCSQTQSGQAAVIVNPLPVASIAGTVEVCVNDTFPDITFSGMGGTPPYAFTYNINGGPSQIATSVGSDTFAVVAVPTTNSGLFNYTLLSVQDGSATQCMQLQTGSANVNIHPLPTATVSGTSSVCQDDAEPAIVFTGANATPPYTFSYSINNGASQTLSSTGPTASINVATSVSGVYEYVLSSVIESSSTTCSQLQDGTATITVNPNPVVDFSLSDSIGCEPLCVDFSDLTTIVSGAKQSWLWDFGDGSVAATLTNPTHCYYNDTATGGSTNHSLLRNVTLTVTSDSGCVGTLTKNGLITVYPTPFATFNINPQTTTIVNPEISIADLSVGVVEWAWNFGDQDTASGKIVSPHTYADTGTYIVTLLVSNQFVCKDTASETVVIEPDFLIYIPNAFTPNGDGINDIFEPRVLFGKDYELRVFDRWGEIVFKSDDVTLGWDGKILGSAEFAKSDVYVYSIVVADLNSKKHQYRGAISLVK